MENASSTRHPRRSRIVGSRRCDVPTALPIMLNAISTQEVGQLHYRATSLDRKRMNQMLKKKEPILFGGRLGWITVLCEKCGIAYDIRDAKNLVTPPRGG